MKRDPNLAPIQETVLFYGLLIPIIDQSENKIIRPWEKKLSQREGNWKFDFQSDRPKTDSILWMYQNIRFAPGLVGLGYSDLVQGQTSEL